MHRGERGVTVVVFAVSVTALLAVGSLVMGGSNGYSAVRNTQTAADAASLAATKTMREVWQEVVPIFADPSDTTSAVHDVAVAVAEENGADPGSVVCEVVTAAYAESNAEAHVLGPCDGVNEKRMAADGFPLAGGVRVTVQETRDVPLGGILDRDTITADGVAAATVQPVRGGFRAPFMLCAFGGDHGIDLLVHDPTLEDGVAPELDPPYKVNPDALGVEFLLWANGNGFGSRNCDVTPWHGLLNSDVEYQVPSDPDDDEGWWDIDTGSRVGHLPRLMSGPDVCQWDASDVDENTAGCRMILPLCVGTNEGEGTNVRFNCVRLGTFRITYIGDGDQVGSCASVNKKVVCGRLLREAGLANGGRGTYDPVDPFEYAVVNLVE